MTILADATEIDLDAFRATVEAHLEAFLAGKAQTARSRALPQIAVEQLCAFLRAGGKRIRPLLCACGWYAAGGAAQSSQVVAVFGAALELFHAFALIHDDIMDCSDLRRGQPTVHRRLAAEFADSQAGETAQRLGQSAAILIGDLALTWSVELVHAAELPPDRRAAALGLLDAMRTEVIYGQYLDLTAGLGAPARVEIPLTVIRYKTAKYTVERPLQLGAVLADGDQRLLDRLSAFALPLGEAFQLRDDLLGIFGDPRETGKSRLDDLREGKYTVLIALAMAAADTRQAAALRSILGNPAITEADAAHARRILTDTGAAARVEEMIDNDYRQAQHALNAAALPAHADRALRSIAEAVAWRRA